MATLPRRHQLGPKNPASEKDPKSKDRPRLKDAPELRNLLPVIPIEMAPRIIVENDRSEVPAVLATAWDQPADSNRNLFCGSPTPRSGAGPPPQKEELLVAVIAFAN
jgi:hypothetical protein